MYLYKCEFKPDDPKELIKSPIVLAADNEYAAIIKSRQHIVHTNNITVTKITTQEAMQIAPGIPEQ